LHRGERLSGGQHHQPHRGSVGGEPGGVNADPVRAERDGHDERGVPNSQPPMSVLIMVGTLHR